MRKSQNSTIAVIRPKVIRPFSDLLLSSVLEVSHVSKRFGKFQALKDVSFRVPNGGRALLLGPNGAGKSTMIKAIVGVHRFAGKITVADIDVSRRGVQAREKIGYVPQYSAFYENFTVEQEARFIAKIKGVGRDAIQEKLAIVEMSDATKKTIKSLSGGMRQRFALAAALLTNPPLLIFDEPLANIDLKGQLDFLGLVRNLSLGGSTLLIATHLTGLSEFADQVIVLNRGRKIAEGAPEELLARLDAEETIYLKPKPGKEREVAEILAKANAKIVNDKSATLVVSVPTSAKLTLLNSLFTNGGLLDDLAIEPLKIESSYTKFLQEKAAA
jgi:ABC-type multidrug transport system ATPase subunit